MRLKLPTTTTSRHTNQVIIPSTQQSLRSMSGRDKVSDGTDLHKFYNEQLQELENERIELFGTNESFQKQSLSPQPSSSEHDTAPFSDMNSMTLEEMHAQREVLYAFTDEEKMAWKSLNVDKPLSSEFLDAVNKAREAKAIYEASMNKGLEEKITAIGREMEENKMASKECETAIVKDDIDFAKGSNHHLFTHMNEKGDEASMVDVGHKAVTRRVAVARTSVIFPPEVMKAFDIVYSASTSQSHEMIGKKGPIFSTARLAGIMGAKRTSDLIPLCHPLPLEKVNVEIRLKGNRALIECECCVTHKTGVEMEAMAGASIAALTIYDMVKAVSHNVRIENTELVSKVGGKRNIQNGKVT